MNAAAKTPSAPQPMTADEFREALEILNLNQTSVARFIGFADRTSRRYAADEAKIPQELAFLLRLMVRQRLTTDQVLELAGRPIKARRAARSLAG